MVRLKGFPCFAESPMFHLCVDMGVCRPTDVLLAKIHLFPFQRAVFSAKRPPKKREEINRTEDWPINLRIVVVVFFLLFCLFWVCVCDAHEGIGMHLCAITNHYSC